MDEVQCRYFFSLLWRRQNRGNGSSHNHLRLSAQYQRSSSGHVRRADLQNLWLFKTYSGNLLLRTVQKTTVIPTDLSTTNTSPRTDDNVQGHLLQNYEQKIAHLPDHLQLIKLCSNVGITKTVASGQYFTPRPSTMRNWTNWEDHVESILYFETAQHPKGKGGSVGTRRSVLWRWQSGRYGIEITIESSCGDGTCSWVMIVNGINKKRDGNG